MSELIDRLDLEGHIVSLDAIGCQKNIARMLDMAHADYLLALKANHGPLHKRAEELDTFATLSSKAELSAATEATEGSRG
jgi:predicted transposase YbfD/YdcC